VAVHRSGLEPILLREFGSALGGARAVAIEDSVAEAAKRANLRCAAVTHSYDEARLHAAGADVVVTRLADLTDALLDGSLA
jgi:phosphoglycolate phosphatase-like HAD superfamily hydrolase